MIWQDLGEGILTEFAERQAWSGADLLLDARVARFVLQAQEHKRTYTATTAGKANKRAADARYREAVKADPARLARERERERVSKNARYAAKRGAK